VQNVTPSNKKTETFKKNVEGRIQAVESKLQMNVGGRLRDCDLDDLNFN